MAKSDFAIAVDAIQASLKPHLKQIGFRVRGRTFNRTTEDGLTQVINLQMGASDPPGTTYFPGLRENLHGLFTVNCGVYVPEVAEKQLGGPAKSWVQEYHCCVRSRIGGLIRDGSDLWWKAQATDTIVDDVRRCIEEAGLPFLDRFATRDKILTEWKDSTTNFEASSPSRIVSAIILAGRGQSDQARALLAVQMNDNTNPGHTDYVRKLARELGLGRLDV